MLPSGNPDEHPANARSACLTSTAGFYFRVIEEGEIGAGDAIRRVEAGPERVSVAEVDGLLYLPGHPRDQLRRALRIPALVKAGRDRYKR